MTVGSIAESAFRLLRERPGAVLIWMIISLATSVATSYAFVAITDVQAAAMMAGQSEASAVAAALPQTLLLGVVTLMVSMVVCAAVLRAALRPDEGGPGALRLGMDEVRLFLLALLYIVLFLIGTAIVAIPAALMIGPAGSQATTLVVVALTLALGSYFYTKLSLSFPLTLIRKRFVIGEAWTLTNGRFWTLFAVYLIFFLILFGLSMLAALATDHEYFAALFQGGFDSEQAKQAAMHEYQVLSQGSPDGTLMLRWASDAVLGGLSAALFGGASAAAVKQLSVDHEGLSETFS
jgi:hypothetical protein